jgi:hypothetical protein
VRGGAEPFCQDEIMSKISRPSLWRVSLSGLLILVTLICFDMAFRQYQYEQHSDFRAWVEWKKANTQEDPTEKIIQKLLKTVKRDLGELQNQPAEAVETDAVERKKAAALKLENSLLRYRLARLAGNATDPALGELIELEGLVD